MHSQLIFPCPVLFISLLSAQIRSCSGRIFLPQLGVRERKLHDLNLKTRLSADAIFPSEAASEFSATVADLFGGIDVFKRGGGGSGGNIDLSGEAMGLYGYGGEEEASTSRLWPRAKGRPGP